MYENGESVLPKKQNSIGLDAIVLEGKVKPNKRHIDKDEITKIAKFLFLFSAE